MLEIFGIVAFAAAALAFVAVSMAMCACFKRKNYVPMTSSQHDENLRLPLSKHASPVCGDLPEGRASASPSYQTSYQGSPSVREDSSPAFAS